MRIFSLVLFAWVMTAAAEDAKTPGARQYTFAWGFVDGSRMEPRGGTTKGPPVKLMTEPTEDFKRLQEPGLSSFERDRRAILAMAGGYRTSFDFLEVAGFTKGFKPDRPYQSWATERVYVLEDRDQFISLQHLLVMSILDKDGKVQGPFVTKHWRQDWQYQPADQFVYRGDNTWQRVRVPEDSQRGAWRQSVYQVDDSPRYSGVARWQHFGNLSSWESPEGWRPLPRREFSVRNDYHVLIGTNRHIILPTGWVHEQQNLKVALGEDDKPRAAEPVIAREFGYNRYERIQEFDWSAGDRYLASTAPLWKAVRKEWADLIAGEQPLRLRAAPDKDQLFIPLFEHAEKLVEGEKVSTAATAAFAAKAVADYLREPGQITGGIER
ncbi:MAG: hypothetical protein M3Q32_06820 [Pseudomonadota bacterium]|nr:hypothetical protein [Pseudomonadota bacterium]